MDLIDHAKSNGIAVMAWTADELYGRDGAFLDGLDERKEAYVIEIPPDAHVWLTKPKVLKQPPRNRHGRPKKYPRLRKRERQPSEVRNLATYSPAFRKQTPQQYRIKDSHRGSEVWEIRWATCWRKTHTDNLLSTQCTLIVSRNVLTDETKYFLSNRVPGRDGWSLRKILRIAFGRWPVEDCFRETKEELGLDHFECRGWRCIHRHLFVTILSQLFCARVRQQLSPDEDVLSGELLTMEQVRRATNVVVGSMSFRPALARGSIGKNPPARTTMPAATLKPANRTARQDENDWPNSASTPRKSNPSHQNHRLHRIKLPNMALSS